MRKETSCGTVIIKDKKVLLLFQNNGFWSFPKGHIEPGESEIETAKRETKEETGLDVEIFPEKRFLLNYYIEELDIDKYVVLFLAKIIDDKIFERQETEIEEMRWVPISEVENYFSRDPWRKVWEEILEEI